MRIGIDISQIVYDGTGVATYVKNIVRELAKTDKKNTYILFGSSLRQYEKLLQFRKEILQYNTHVQFVLLRFPPTFFDFIWNRLHIIPVSWFTGNMDIFWSSDWTQPPLGKVKGVTTIHDVSILKVQDTMSEPIRAVHTRKLARSVKECSVFFCDSLATKNDVIELFHIYKDKIHVVYPGISL